MFEARNHTPVTSAFAVGTVARIGSLPLARRPDMARLAARIPHRRGVSR